MSPTHTRTTAVGPLLRSRKLTLPLTVYPSIAAGTLAIFLTLFVAGAVLLGLIGEPRQGALALVGLLVGVPACVAAVELVRHGVRNGRDPRGATGKCLRAGAAAGASIVPLTWVAICLVTCVGFHELSVDVLLATLGTAVATGLAFGVPGLGIFASAVLPVVRQASRGDLSHEGLDRLTVRCGGWLVAVGTLCAAVTAGLTIVQPSALGACAAAGAVSAAVSFVGVVVCLRAWRALRRRAEFISLVERGAVTGWALLSVEAVQVEIEELRPLFTGSVEPTRVLVREGPPSGAGAYRRRAALVPVATL